MWYSTIVFTIYIPAIVKESSGDGDLGVLITDSTEPLRDPDPRPSPPPLVYDDELLVFSLVSLSVVLLVVLLSGGGLSLKRLSMLSMVYMILALLRLCLNLWLDEATLFLWAKRRQKAEESPCRGRRPENGGRQSALVVKSLHSSKDRTKKKKH